jgi:dTMP kinase
MPALIVAIEGPDFSGKSTIANLLVEILRKNNKNIFFKRTEIPSTLTTGFFTKILRNSADDVSSEVFSLAYAADQLNHYQIVIKPLKESKERYVVIQERSLLSTFLYQSIIGKAEMNWVEEINKFDKNIPDLTIVLKLDLDEILKRSSLEKKDFDKFEVKKHLEEEVKAYNNPPAELVRQFNIRHVNADTDPENIAERCGEMIQKEIDKFFKK